MKNIFLVLVLTVVLVSLGVSTNAHAYGSYRASSYSDGSNGWLIQTGGIYYFTTEGGNPPYSPNTTITRQLINFLVGYHFNLFFLGANYNYDSIVTSGNTTNTDSFRSFGGDLGLMTDNVYLLFTYYFNSSATTGAGTTSNRDLNNGTGYQISLGYNFDMGSGFGIGPALTYKSLTYSSLSSGASTSFTYTTLVPEANIRYTF